MKTGLIGLSLMKCCHITVQFYYHSEILEAEWLIKKRGLFISQFWRIMGMMLGHLSSGEDPTVNGIMVGVYVRGTETGYGIW